VNIEGAACGYVDVVDAACSTSGIEGALVDIDAHCSAGEADARDPTTCSSAGSDVKMSVAGVEARTDDPAGSKNCVNPMGTKIGLVKVSRNSKFARVGVRLWSAKGKEDSSKIT
jgi:hypothetical protein